MAQKTTGIYKILNAPFLYELVQNIFWKKGKRKEFIEKNIKLLPGLRVLDVGCGTGLLFKSLSEFSVPVHYVGLDLNLSYTEYASRLYQDAQFFCCDVVNLSKLLNEKFNIIVIMNVLHHLNDAQVNKLFSDCRQYLQEDGCLLTLDPVRTPHASLLERVMIEGDRGQHIRTKEGYYRLAENSFKKINQKLETGFLKIPMTVNILECIT